jgi:hypothetical protein
MSALAQGREGVVPLALLIGLLLAGIGGMAAVIVRNPQPAGRNRTG